MGRCFICLRGVIFGLPEGQAQSPPENKGERREKRGEEKEREKRREANHVDSLFQFISNDSAYHTRSFPLSSRRAQRG